MWAPLWNSDLVIFDWEELHANIQEHKDGNVKDEGSLCSQGL